MSERPYADFSWPQCSNCETPLTDKREGWECPNCGARWEDACLIEGDPATSWEE